MIGFVEISTVKRLSKVNQTIARIVLLAIFVLLYSVELRFFSLKSPSYPYRLIF